MLYFHMQKSQKILSLFILISFGLLFAQSEFNLFSKTNDYKYCGNKNSGLDYCGVVKVAKIEKTDNLQKRITIQLISFNDCCDECKEIKDILQNAQFTSKKKFFNTSTFLVNRTLLI